jgi:tetratricopeptide (TPR) repeat protein
MKRGSMKFSSRWIAALFFFLVAFIPAQAQSYDSELQLGVRAYKSGRYEQAMRHFRKAAELDPSQPNPHLYLATALTGQYIPGVESPDNLLMAEQAIEQYQRVLDLGPEPESKMNCLKGIAYLYLNEKKWDDAKKYYRMASELDPNDPEPYYSIGVIDWTACYQPRMEARAKLGMKPDEHLNPKNKDQAKVCQELKEKNTPSISEAIDSLNEAIQLRPDYDDAMAYLNLVYREKADVECDDPSLRDQDLRTADEWVDKTLETKRAKAWKAMPAQTSPQ